MKWAVLSWSSTVLVGLVVEHVQGAAEWVILSAAAVGGLTVLHAKVLRPTLLFSVKAHRGIDILLELPSWTQRVESRLEALERAQQRPIEAHVEVHQHDSG